jgi:flagellar protein FlaF
MENLIITLACISLILFGAANMVTVSMKSVDEFYQSWSSGQKLATERALTKITALSAQTNIQGDQVTIRLRNEGNLPLCRFASWDVILKYGDGDTIWLPYRQTAPGWNISGIYFQGLPEVLQPGILDPGEEMDIVLQTTTPVSENVTSMAMVSTYNGITTRILFRR